jgi:predicted alpha/beta hydrolase family esterase
MGQAAINLRPYSAGTTLDLRGQSKQDEEPLVLLVPGLDNSGPGHWQTLWERDDENCRRVELGQWDKPHRNTWINQLNLAIHRAAGSSSKRPVVLAAHSLGCHVVSWWAKLEQPEYGSPVIGALLVAPPEVDCFPLDERVSAFAPTPQEHLPFPSLLVASRNDPWTSFLGAQATARSWGSEMIDAGECGHLNAEADLGHWPDGRRLLARLLERREVTDTAQAILAASNQGLVQGGEASAG